MHQPGPAYRRDPGLVEAPEPGRLRGQSRHAPGVTGQVRHLEVDGVADRLEGGVEPRPGDMGPRPRLEIEYGVPRGRLFESGEHRLRVGAEGVDHDRVVLAAPVPPDRLGRRRGAMTPAVDLDRTRQRHQSRSQADVVRAQPPREALAVPLLVGLPDRDLDRRREAQPGRQLGAQRRVRREEAAQPAAGGDGQGGDPASALEAGAVRGDPAQEERDHLRGVHVEHLEPEGLERDVVPEPARLLGGVRVAVGADHQAEVVRRLPLRRVGSHQVGQPQRDHGLPQAVVHGLAQPQVGGVRQRRDQLRDPHPVVGTTHVFEDRPPGHRSPRAWTLPLA